MKRFFCLMLVCLLGMGMLGTANIALAEDEESNVVYFDSTLMAALSFSIDNLTSSTETRALAAVLLYSDFYLKIPDYTFDLTQPVYLAQSGSNTLCAFWPGVNEYVGIQYTTNPVTTAYCYFDASSTVMKTLMDMTFDTVWEISSAEIATAASTLSEIISQ